MLPENPPTLINTGDNRGVWDKLRMEQVIINLLSNAVKYGLGSPIKVEVSGTADEVSLKVFDQGGGIAPENHEKIFNRFERVGLSPRGVTGLGLGLFITKRIIEAHGGSITVESDLGKGSCFIVTVPRKA